MKKFFSLFFVAIILIAAVIYAGFIWFDKNSKVYDGDITIFEGASVKQVSELLEANDVIDNADTFYYYIVFKQKYLEYAPWANGTFEVAFKSGTFDIEATSFDELIEYLNEISNIQVNTDALTTIPEGSTIDDIAKILATKKVVSEEAFLKKINDKDYYNSLRKKYVWLPEFNDKKFYQLEGYLHANSYNFDTNMLPSDVIESLLEQTNTFYIENKVEILNSNFTFEEILTLASVVERESKFSEDRPKVAQVFMNRLELGMKLESDITANYGSDEHKVFMTYKDIAVDSPYNTYKVPALPVGPISSPSLESINAVLQPEGKEFKHIFFYARPSGETFYSTSYTEHDKIRLQYEQEWLDLAQ